MSIHELRRASRSLTSLGSCRNDGILVTVSVSQESEDISEPERSPSVSTATSPPQSPAWPVSEPPWGEPPGTPKSDKAGVTWSIGPIADKVTERAKVPLLSAPPARKRYEKAALPLSLGPIPEKTAFRLSAGPELANIARHRSRSPKHDNSKRRASVNVVELVEEKNPAPVVLTIEDDKPVTHSFDRPIASSNSKRALPSNYTVTMASRGARARKVTEKAIQKEEKKHVEKDRQERFARLHSPIGSVNTSTRPFSPSQDKNHFTPWNKTMSPNQSSSASITSNGSNGSSGFSSVLGSRLSSIDERKKYTAKGKATSAPRGRGGGVPVKLKNVDETRSKSSFSYSTGTDVRSNKSRSQSVSSDNARPSFEKSWVNTKLYVGGGQPAKAYQGFEHDDDMWMADGDCLIFFSEETSEEDPRPMLRVHKGVLEQAKSTFMINLLRYGEIVHEDDDTPPSSAGPTPATQSQWPLTPTSLGNLDSLLSDGRRDPKSPPLPGAKYNPDRDTWSTSDQTLFGADRDRPRTGAGSAKAPMSGAGTAIQTPAQSVYGGDLHDDNAVEITHEIWFRAPSHIKRPDIQRRHHMATRNYIALL